MTAATPLPGATVGHASPWRTLRVLAMVLIILAGLLRLLDEVPGWIRGEPRTLRDYPSVEALERDTRTQLVLPFYYPDWLAWPPVGVYRAPGDGRPTSVVIAARETTTPRLVIAQCLDGPCRFPPRLLPAGREVSRTRVMLAGAPAWIVRRQDAAGAAFVDVAWQQFGRSLHIRLYGDDRDLLRIARSMRRGHP